MGAQVLSHVESHLVLGSVLGSAMASFACAAVLAWLSFADPSPVHAARKLDTATSAGSSAETYEYMDVDRIT